MSTQEVKKELLDATGLEQKKGEDNEAFYRKLVRAVSNLEDAAWEGLSKDAQTWANNGVDAIQGKEEIQGFEGDEEPADDPPPRRRARLEDDPPADEPKGPDYDVKDTLKGDDISKLVPGTEVCVVGSNDSETEGTVVEVNDSQLVLDVKGEEVNKSLRRIAEVEVVALPKVDDGGGSSGSDDGGKSDKKEDKKSDKEPEKKSRGRGGVTQALREMICGMVEDGEAPSKDDVLKAAKKTDLEFKDSTLDILYNDTAKTIAALKEAGKLG